MLTEKSEEQQRNEVYVLRAAKELAKVHVCDVIQSTIDKLISIKWDLLTGHDEKNLSENAKPAGFVVADRTMRYLLDDAPINYRSMVCEANEDDAVIDEDTVQDDLRSFVTDLMRQWQESPADL